jgi:serine protease Do
MDQNNHTTKSSDITPRNPSRKKLVVTGLVSALTALFLMSGAISAAYIMGVKNGSPKYDSESTRQTVVQEGEVIADVAQEVGKSVVSLMTEQQRTVESLYFGRRMATSQAAGTGVIIDTEGHVLTNKHVVAEGTKSVSVVTYDGTEYKADIIGRDPLNDLAIIKVQNPKDFVPARLADSDTVRIGQKVIAIGNALGRFQNTVTSGIISGMGRPVAAGSEYDDEVEQLSNLFQTDAAINSGNSGGPLLNFNGEVIGINTAVAAEAQNIGFAIPINEAKSIIASVQKTGKVARPFLGVQFVMLTDAVAKQFNLSITEGAYIGTSPGTVVADSPAQKAGVKPGDVITKVNDITLTTNRPLTSAISRFAVGDTITITVVRDGKEQQLQVTLVAAPNS